MGNRNLLLQWCAFILPLAMLFMHTRDFQAFTSDDVFISLRYAERLLEGKGLTWNDGYYVEGYSNLSWVLLAAGLGWLGVNLETSIFVITCFSAAFMMLAVCWYGRLRNLPPASVFLANMVLATASPIAIWIMGGLETMLLTALVTWCAVLALSQLETMTRERMAALGVLLGLVSITRPEGFGLTPILLGAMLLCSPNPRRALLPLIGTGALASSFFFAQLAFRLHYYGAWLPNTYYAKVAFSIHRMMGSIYYTLTMMEGTYPLVIMLGLWLAACLLLKVTLPWRRSISFCLLLIGGWSLLLLFSGGDYFVGFRYWLPTFPLAALILLIADGSLRTMLGRLPQKALLLAGMVILSWHLHTQRTSPDSVWAQTENFAWGMRDVGLKLHEITKDHPDFTIAVTPAGAIPFYSKLTTIDILGLNDTYLTSHRSENFGKGFVGHELHDTEYVYSRQPAAIIFAAPETPWFDMAEHPDFQLYHYILLDTGKGWSKPIYVRDEWMFLFPDAEPAPDPYAAQ